MNADELKMKAEAFAAVWLVNAIDRVMASLKNSDDIPTVLEVAFTDGYLTGYSHAKKELPDAK